MNEDWEGQERRADGGNDHDILIRIEEYVKTSKKDFSDHESLDNDRFSSVFRRLSNVQKFQWLMAGGFIVLNVVLVVFGNKILEALG